MRILKYIFSILLMVWGLLTTLVKLFSIGPHFPILTLITIIAIVLGLGKYKKADFVFFVVASLWMLASSETMGFVLFFDVGNYERMLVALIPFLLSGGVLFTTQIEFNPINSFVKKLLLVSFLILIGICSYVYKPTTEEVNCWYYLDNDETYKVVFSKTPQKTFEVELSSAALKNELRAEAIQYEERNGYYCPETKVRVVTCFGKIISAKIMAFRNSEVNKKVNFSRPTKIPLDKINGKLEILKPYTLRVWN